jgi:hypothetical protein
MIVEVASLGLGRERLAPATASGGLRGGQAIRACGEGGERLMTLGLAGAKSTGPLRQDFAIIRQLKIAASELRRVSRAWSSLRLNRVVSESCCLWRSGSDFATLIAQPGSTAFTNGVSSDFADS